MTYGLIFFFFYILLSCIVISYCALIVRRSLFSREVKIKRKIYDNIISYIADNQEISELAAIVRKYKILFIFQWIEINETLEVSDAKKTEIVKLLVDDRHVDRYYFRRLESCFRYRRIQAAIVLGYLGTSAARLAIESQLVKEKRWTTKLYFCGALAKINNIKSVSVIVDSVIGSPDSYQKRISLIIKDFGNDLLLRIDNYFLSQERDIKVFLLYLGELMIDIKLKNFLVEMSKDEDEYLSVIAVKSLTKFYSHLLWNDYYLRHNNKIIRNTVIESLDKSIEVETMRQLFSFLGDQESAESAIHSLNKILVSRPDWLSEVLDYYKKSTDPKVREGLISILSDRVEYFFLKLSSNQVEDYSQVIVEIIEAGKINTVIGFLNKSRNTEMLQPLIDLLSQIISRRQDLLVECSTYLKDNILDKLGLKRMYPVSSKRIAKKEADKIKALKILFLVVILSPIIFFIWYVVNHIGSYSLMPSLDTIILEFNYNLAFYSIAINSIYIGLLVLSLVEGHIQNQNYQFKKNLFLFRPGILPSISIIAPAFNEEVNILESVHSLLNLSYPDYELIVVNDGSMDDTLSVLIDNFQLTRVDTKGSYPLNTQSIRGLYKNFDFPRLIVVDKANGGKADSLNVGINIATKDFFCGIDADSLLEPEALLRAVATSLDSDDETVAIGGNIYPINGCKVEHGHIAKKAIPNQWLARFQMIEYLRAFMAGRLGWARMDMLLIISGAFGVFNRKRIIDIGGYLTEKGIFNKDTVGEDMELVIRLIRHMRESKLKYKVSYAYNANCWTEVPEKLNTFVRQRDRWQRGLIDILYFHRKLIANPRYGRVGLIGLPYFLIFEAIGPLFESMGLVFIVLALFLGLLNPAILILLFSSSVLMGIVVSVTSLVITRDDLLVLPNKEINTLLWYAFIENFGFRQFCSILRVQGYISSIRQQQGWGKMERKGFKAK